MHEHAKYQIQTTKWIFEGGNMDIDVHNIIPFVYENKKISYVYFKWQPVPVFLPGESQGRGAWWAAVYGVAESETTEAT